MNEKFIQFNQGMVHGDEDGRDDELEQACTDYMNQGGELPEYLAELLLAIGIHNPGG